MTASEGSAGCTHRGPAWDELAAAGVTVDEEDARAAEAMLLARLGDAPDAAARVRSLYLPVLLFVEARARAAKKRPIVVGVSAPQGAGKSTLVAHLEPVLAARGLRGVSVSLDDFYLTRAEQLRLAAAHPGNELLEHRGYPGTHDVGLGARTLDALSALGDGGEARLPAYDKSAHAGRGDRRPEAEWQRVRGPLDVVLVEGWMLAFAPPQPGGGNPQLAALDAELDRYRALTDRLDALVALRADDDRFVEAWRVEAEDAARAAGRPALSPADTRDYIRRFLPAYVRWAPSLDDDRFPRARQMRLRIGPNRLPREPR
jgi:D-glycerate 3-kinase